MPNDTIPIIHLYLRHALPFLTRLLYRKLLALHHRLTYSLHTPSLSTTTTPPSPPTPTIIIIGASFAGLEVTRRLLETLPPNHRVILLERHTQLHYVFAFPRFSVVPGYEACAFVPYDALERGALRGMLERRVGVVKGVREGQVVLKEEGKEDEDVVLPFTALVVATGCEQAVPARLASCDREGACAELRAVQGDIKAAERIAVVGGGAVGVELAADIKDYYPGKEVTLVHSRMQLLGAFGGRLHEYALGRLEELGVRVVLGDRPVVSGEGGGGVEGEGKGRTLIWSSGEMEEFDLIIPCTGAGPNSSLLQNLCPSAISAQTGRILVNEHLQVCDAEGHVPYPHVFALGDVAETGAPKMARAAMMQAEIVVQNVLGVLSKTGKVKQVYQPQREIEGAIKLTLGIKHFAMWMREDGGRELMMTSDRGREDMGVAGAWSWYGTGAKDMPKRREV